VTSLPTRIGVAVGAGIVALMALGTTVWFLGDALVLLLSAKGFEPAAASALTGLAGLASAVLLGLVAKWVARPRRHVTVLAASTDAAGSAVNAYAAEIGAIVAQQVVVSARAHPYTTVGAALAVGLALGAVQELRKSLNGFLKH
jgi:hypothetical protein